MKMTTSRTNWFLIGAAKLLIPGLALPVLLVAGGGCASSSSFGVDQTIAHPAVSSSEDVKVRPGLVISMSVLVAGKKEIDEPAKRVTDRGTLTLPLLGEMTVSNMSLEDLQAKLVACYKVYYVQPQVILDFVRDGDGAGISPWGFVTVLGRVKEPGRVPIPATRDMTVSGAIQMTGGFAPSAKDTAILVTRTLPNGQTKTSTINFRSVGAAGRVEEDILLEANDVVFVPESTF
jgi:polysaccharide biosynthesis/export protein